MNTQALHDASKAAFNRTAGALGLVAAAPVMGAIALAIKIDDPDAPVMFKQPRIGKDGELFDIYKFRTMTPNKEREQAGGSFTLENDPQVTKIGSFLRKSHLDELPQLINVAKGEMHLVGPRPITPSHLGVYQSVHEECDKRHDVRPGISGWGQNLYVGGKAENDETRRQVVEQDVAYAKADPNIFRDMGTIAVTLSRIAQKALSIH
jgi:lipopolysaccharide/colanic/teichoic acid biosynthesis glycosyltransferase